MADPDALAAIADLREFAAEAHAPGSPAARIAEGLRAYLAEDGVTLEQALGIATPRGVRTWRQQERQQQARAAIARLRDLVPASEYNSNAIAIRAAVSRYKDARWRFDSERDSLAAVDETRVEMHALLRATGGEVPSRRSVERALHDCATRSRPRGAGPVV